MNVAINTGVYGDRPLPEVARRAAADGYEAVVLDLSTHDPGGAPDELTDAVAARLADTFAARGLAIAAVRLAGPLTGGPGDRAPTDLAVALGTDLLLGRSGPGEHWTATLEALEKLVDEAAEQEIVVALELAEGQAVANLDDAELLLDAIDSDCLGLALEPVTEAELAGIGLAELLDRLGDELALVSVGEDSADELPELLDLLAEQAPDATVMVSDIAAADAAAWQRRLARWQ